MPPTTILWSSKFNNSEQNYKYKKLRTNFFYVILENNYLKINNSCFMTAYATEPTLGYC